MKVKVSVYHGPSGSGRTDLDVPFVPGETTVGQALEEAASRLAASGGAKGANGTDENGVPLPNLTLARAPSEVRPVTSLYIGQDWIKNTITMFPFAGNKKVRYHVVPALIGSDEEESDDDDSSEDVVPVRESRNKKISGSPLAEDDKSGISGTVPSKIRSSSSVDTFNVDGCRLMMICSRYPSQVAPGRKDIFSEPYSKPYSKSSALRQNMLTSRLYEYHSQEGLLTTVWNKIKAICIPLDDRGSSSLRVDLTEFGEIRSVFKEQRGEEETTTEEADIVLPVTGGGAAFSDIKSVGK